MLIQLEAMIEEYVALAAELRRKTSAFSAIMGNRENVGHPGHMAFYDWVKDWTERVSAQDPGQTELYQALELLLLSAEKYSDTAAYWYLIAIQSHAKMLVPKLDAEHRKTLCGRYESLYPSEKRLPIQEEVFQLLGGKEKRKLFRFL